LQDRAEPKAIPGTDRGHFLRRSAGHHNARTAGEL